MEVPKDLRDHFGARRFFQSLGTESQSEAERLVLAVVARWKAKVEAFRTGTDQPLEDLALEWAQDYERAAGDSEMRAIYKGVLEKKSEALSRLNPAGAEGFKRIVLGEAVALASHIEEWLAASDNEPKTIDMKRSDVTRFVQDFPYAHQVDKKAVERWVHERRQKDGIKAGTAGRWMSHCRSYWAYLNRAGHINREDNCFSGVVEMRSKKSKAAATDERRAFEPAELVTLWRRAGAKQDVQLQNLIWLGMWTGCRIEEMCSLRISEVSDGLMTIVDAKTRAGNRTVPVHPALAPALADWCSTSPDGYVLGDLSRNKYGGRSNAIGKRFGRLKKEMGFGSVYVFHSVRKTVTTLLENAGVPENITADILGHDKPTMTYGIYSGGASIDVKRAAIEKLSYPIAHSEA